MTIPAQMNVWEKEGNLSRSYVYAEDHLTFKEKEEKINKTKSKDSMLYNQIELVFNWRLGTRARPSSLVGSRTRARSLSLVGSIIFQNLGEPNQRWPPSPLIYQWQVSYHTSKTSEPWRCRDSREPSWDHSVISGRFTLVGGLRRGGRSAARGIYSGGRSAARWAVCGARDLQRWAVCCAMGGQRREQGDRGATIY